MEGLVVKVLKKQLKLFIKNFNADQLTISAMKGEGQMTDLDLNEKVIQELLYIPMNLEVTKASCDLLNLKVPWTSLNSKPVTLTLNKVDIDLREPVEINHRPSALKREKPKTKGDVTDNMMLIINNVHMTVQTLGGALVMIDLDDIVIQSTNSKWEAVDLAQSRDVDKEQGVESLFKKLTIRSINLALLTERSAHMVLQQIPFKILFASKRRSKDWTLLSADLEFILEKLNFRWTADEFALMVDLIRGFQGCLSRPVPKSPLLPTSTSNPDLVQTAVKPEVSYKLKIDHWALDFIEEISPVEKGYSFFGEGLHITFNSAKTVNLPKPADGYSSPNLIAAAAATIEVEETLITATVHTVKFRELLPRDHTPPFFVTQKDTSAAATSALKHLLTLSLTLRRPTATVNIQNIPIIGVEFSVALSNLQLVADRTVWKSLIRFFNTMDTPSNNTAKPLPPLPGATPTTPPSSAPITAIPPGSTPPEGSSMEDSKGRLSQLKERLRLTDDWQSQIKITVKASDLRVIIPGEESGEYEGLSLHLDLGSFGVSNYADWKVTPNLSKGLAILAAPLPAPPVVAPRVVGTPHKLSFHLEGVSMSVLAKGQESNILEPAGVNLFVHYFEREGKTKTEKGKPQIEVVFHSGEFNLHANEQQGSYLKWIGKKYLNPQKIKSALNARVKKAKAKAVEKLKDFKDSTPQAEMVKPIQEKVSNALDAYKWTVFIHIDKGVFKVPLQYFIAPHPADDSHPSPAAPIFDPLTSNSDESVNAVIEGDILHPCKLKFEHLDLAAENNMNGQGVVVKLGSFQATGVDHPRLPSTISLLPLEGGEEDKLPAAVDNCESLLFRYKRKRKPTRSGESDTNPDDEDAFITEVLGRLQRMHVKIGRKPDHPGFRAMGGGMGLPDVQAVINRAVSLIQERRGDIKTLQQNVKQIHFDVKWAVELGNCEVALEKVDDSQTGSVVFKPYGTVRLVDVARPSLIKTCKDFESRLVTAKFSLAQNEIEKEEQNSLIFELQAALAKAEKEKAAAIAKIQEDYIALETKFVQTKVAMAQMQEEVDNLSSNRTKKK